MKRFLLLLILLFVGGHAYAIPLSSRTYGDPWWGDYLSNVVIKSNKAAIRFRSEHTGTFDKTKTYIVGEDNTQNLGCATFDVCYGHGTGGTIRVQLQTDDGTANHFPSGTVLSTFDIVNPKTSSTYTTPGPPNYGYFDGSGREGWPLLDFPNVSITEGTIYHLVYSNIDADVTQNWVSINNLGSDMPLPNQPEVSQTDLASLINFGSAWELRDKGGGTFPGFESPTYEVRFTDGFVQGQGHIEARPATPKAIYGTNKVRERFTVTGGSRLVSRVNVRVSKTGSPPALDIRLEKTDGTLVEAGSIPAASITGTTIQSAASYTFSSPLSLTNGQGYNLILSAATGTASNYYSTHALLSGENYGFLTHFSDGEAESTTNGTTWGVMPGSGFQDDLQVYFTMADAPMALVAHYKMNESSGTTASDSSGNGLNGTLTGATFTPGIIDNALILNGASQWLRVTDNGLIDLGTGDFTLSAWFYMNSLPGDWEGIISKGSLGSIGYGLYINASNVLTATIFGSGGADQSVSFGSPQAGTWNHAAAVYDRDDKVYVYLNGVLAGSSTFTAGNTGSVTNAVDLFVGAYNNTFYWWNGKIDDARVYDNALTAAEVRALYDEVLPVEIFQPRPVMRTR